MQFQPERLVFIRNKLGINKAEAARRLNMSAMGYGRYENGNREPSFQVVNFIAKTFDTTADFLYGITDESNPESITISQAENPDLYLIIKELRNDTKTAERVAAYLKSMKELRS